MSFLSHVRALLACVCIYGQSNHVLFNNQWAVWIVCVHAYEVTLTLMFVLISDLNEMVDSVAGGY